MTEPNHAARPRRRLRLALGALALGVGLGLVAARAWLREDRVAVAPPVAAVTDLERSEAAAGALERALREGLVGAIAVGEREAPRAMLAPGFRATLDDLEVAPRRGSDPVATTLTPGGDVLDGEAFLDRLEALVGGWDRCVHLEAEADAFALDAADDSAAYARVHLRWAGVRSVADDARVDVRLYVELAARREGASWRLEALELFAGSTLEGTPRFRDVAREVGFTWAESARNRELGQAFIDQHRTLALGGLSVVDLDRDGFHDLLAARAGEFSVWFRNDGQGGFVPEPLPAATADEHPAFYLAVDLDGDGVEELVGSRPTGYEGERVYVGLWRRATRTSPWEHRPRAFTLPNRVGVRRLAIQTVVPFDLEGDGDLDLFFAVYGDGNSRGERYNTVDAHDGADNHLLVNHGALEFTEESDERGITGTRYTYVATAFDFDGDGDTDVFEGNDFGPNVLWANDGAGRFTEDTKLGFGGVPAYTMGATLADFDNSGRWSLYVSNMSSEQGMRMVPLAEGLGPRMRETVATIARGNMLYTEGDTPGAPWRERALELGVNEGEWAWGASFADLDNDGDRDLYVTNGFTSHRDRKRPDFQAQYWRQVIADGRALERGEAARSALSRATPTSFNGYELDRCFLNLGDGPLPDAAYVLGLESDLDGRAVAPLDMDGDGDLDLALWTLQRLVLFENTGPEAAFVRIALRARGGASPPLGAVVTVRSGAIVRRDVVKLVDGFQTQVLADLHFGLGDAEALESVEVRWPSGHVDVWRDVPVRRRVTLDEGASEVGLVAPLPAWPAATRPEGGEPRATTLLPGAIGGYDTPHAVGRRLVLRVARAGALAWDAPDALGTDAPADVRFARVLADGAWQGAPASARSEADLVATRPWLVEGFGRHFAPDSRDPAQAADDASDTGAHGPDAAVAVFDARGELVRVFRGDPPLADLARVLAAAADEPAFPGLLVEHGRMALDEHRYRDAAALFQESLRLLERDPPAWEGLGRAQVLLGRLDLAEQAYASAVRADPDYALGHYNLAVTRTHLGRPADAIAPLREAVRIEGPLPRTLLALGEAAAAAGELGVALETYEALLQDEPRRVDAHVGRGKVLARLGRLAEAQAALEAALAIAPDNGDARAALVKVTDLQAR